MKDSKNIFGLLVLCVLFISCGSDTGMEKEKEMEETCTNNILSGTVQELPWTFAAGVASIFDDEMNIDFYSTSETLTDGDVCQGVTRMSPYIFGRIKSEVGRTDLDNPFSGNPDAKSLTIFDPATNLNIIIGEGYIEILSVTDTKITGELNMGNGEEEVCGPFELEICF